MYMYCYPWGGGAGPLHSLLQSHFDGMLNSTYLLEEMNNLNF